MNGNQEIAAYTDDCKDAIIRLGAMTAGEDLRYLAEAWPVGNRQQHPLEQVPMKGAPHNENMRILRVAPQHGQGIVWLMW